MTSRIHARYREDSEDGFAGGDPVNFWDPFGLCPPQDRNFADCSDEVMRLLNLDKPIVDISAETFFIAAGVVGSVRGAFLAAGRLIAGRAAAEAALGPSAGMMRQFSRQRAEHGRGSVEKSIRSLEG